MKQPDFLKKGDKIAIVGLAKKIERVHIDNAIRIFEHWGLEVILGENLFSDYFRFSATDEQRALDFQKALDDPGIKALISARGGYGSMRIIDRINWDKFIEKPKWVIGFSDITAVLGSIFNRNVQSIHGIMPAFFHLSEAGVSIENLRKVLFGKKINIEFPGDALNSHGEATGELVGGNLSLLCNMMNSDSDFDYQSKILFIEDIDEHLYRIDRMLLQLKRAGCFNHIKGLLVGHFTDLKDNSEDPFGKDVNEIISEYFKEYEIPIAFGLPVGHDAVNNPLIIGRQYVMRVDSQKTILI